MNATRFFLAAALAAAPVACAGGASSPSLPTAIPPIARTHAGAALAPLLYVAERSHNAILGFALGANGNVAPARVIAGSRTQLGSPASLAMNAAGTVFVADDSDRFIWIFRAGERGNVPPVGSIAGSATGLFDIEGLAFDSAQNLYVCDYLGATISVFAAGARGNVAPVRTLSGAETDMRRPSGIALDAAGELIVADRQNGVLVYAPGAGGNAAPIRHAVLQNMNPPTSVTLDKSGRIWVVDEKRVAALDANANGYVTPSIVIAGSNTGLVTPTGVAFDSAGNIYVSDGAAGAIFEFAPGANGNVAPIAKIRGKTTMLDDPLSPLVH